VKNTPEKLTTWDGSVCHSIVSKDDVLLVDHLLNSISPCSNICASSL
jgi:hypothetical protein